MGFLDNLAKVASASAVPAGIVAAETKAGMDVVTPLGPGTPITPADGFSTVPRAWDYRSGYNIAGRPRVNERISFSVLRGLLDSYDIAQICITHRIDSVRSHDWRIVPAEGIEDDMTEAIKLARKILEHPDPADPDLTFRGWLAKYLWDVLGYDAGTLYRVRNYAGAVCGLRVIDGTTIAPLLDAWGNKPGYDFAAKTWAPAYLQYVQGMTWDWLTVRDLIYAPFRPTSNSPYGRAPLESILINANTDIRFQVYFLQRFTSGNIPEGFAISPEKWTPDQITAWQATWDAFLMGDQAIMNQIKWVPGGTTFEFPNEQEFSSDFSLFLMRKTAAAYHVTPADLGFTEDVNRASGESQGDVQERVGDLPLMQHVADILTSFLQQDLGVPLVFEFDTGGIKPEDAKAQAETDKIYWEIGASSSSEIRERVYGQTEKDGELIPRTMMTPQGPVPLSVIVAMSGPVSDETAGPLPGSVVPGSLPATALAGGSAATVQKALETAKPEPLVKVALEPHQRAEISAFGRFLKRAKQAGEWRDFTFKTLPPVLGHRLNAAGYAEIRKADGEIGVAGLAVLAADTGRVLMLQRALDPDDPAGGSWEFPGGHIEPGESPIQAAKREWAEEVGVPAPDGALGGTWVSPNGHYGGFVVVVESEDCCTPHQGRDLVTNPDDPDGDWVEAVAWWDPRDLVGNPAVRVELAADISLVLAALKEEPYVIESDEVAPVVKGGPPLLPGDSAFAQGFNAQVMRQRASGAAADEVPAQEDDVPPFRKASWRSSSAKWPGHRYDVALTDYYAPKIAKVLDGIVVAIDIPDLLERYDGTIAKAVDPEKVALVERILRGVQIPAQSVEELRALLDALTIEGFETGVHAAAEQLGAAAADAAGHFGQAFSEVDWANWEPGMPLAASQVAGGALQAALDEIGITIRGITDSVMQEIGNRIAEGLIEGHGSTKIEREIRDLLGGGPGKVSFRAERIAHTEVARAQTTASMLLYKRSGVTEYELIISDGACPECVALEEGNPYAIGDDTARVPIHPFCRCADAPVVASIDADLIETVPPEREALA